MTRVFFVTYDGLPDLDPDDRLACELLARAGVSVSPAVWNDPGVDWSGAGLCIVRSTWDYHLHLDAFLAWAERVSPLAPLWNPPALLRWNTRKTYLSDLAGRGVPVVPTCWLGRGARADVGTLLRELGWREAIAKPAVGLSTFKVARISRSGDAIERAQAHLDDLLAQGDAMIQPYLDSVETYGERALVFIDGEYSHAVRKTAFQPLLPAGEAGETLVKASRNEIAVGCAALRVVAEPTLYARVDLVRDGKGAPAVIELELVEPSLFLRLWPAAAERLCRAILKRLPPGMGKGGSAPDSFCTGTRHVT